MQSIELFPTNRRPHPTPGRYKIHLLSGSYFAKRRQLVTQCGICNNGPMPERAAIHATAFDHVTLVCDDLEASRRFYVDLLGMTEVPRPAFKFPGRWFQLGHVQIHATQVSLEAGQPGWAPQAGTIVSRGHH